MFDVKVKQDLSEEIEELMRTLTAEMRNLTYDSEEYSSALKQLTDLNKIKIELNECDSKDNRFFNWIKLGIESVTKAIELIFNIKMNKADYNLKKEQSENMLAVIYDGYAFEKSDIVSSDTLRRVLNKCKLQDK